MVRKIKFGKIAIVIFLTILIWVWTDLDLDEELSVPRAVIRVAYSPELLVSFNGQSEALINNIRLKGPAKKITDVTRGLDDGSLELDFTLNPEREMMTTTGPRTLNVLDFLKRSDKIKELGGLTVEDCKPEIIDVDIVELVKKSLDIEFFDENGVPVEVQSYDPEKVDMYVPKDSRLKAQVRLTASNINQARLSKAVVFPYVELSPGRRRNSTTPVRVKMSPEADSLGEYNIEDAKLGITLSMNLVGEWKVEVNYNEVVRPFSILATVEAKNAYENQEFQIYLIIPDDYAKEPDKEQRRDVVYNFPEEYVRENKIRLKNPEQKAIAKFKLIPPKSAETPAGPN
jgi:hypothetical protein